jgi:hypothetical protein
MPSRDDLQKGTTINIDMQIDKLAENYHPASEGDQNNAVQNFMDHLATALKSASANTVYNVQP